MSHLLIFHENAYSLSAAFSLEFNILAAQSARAQLLKNPLTTLDGIANNKSHRVHTLVINNLPVAYLKVGEKNLLVQDEFARHVQIYPPCVLDFYVRTDVQRKGYGKTLFQHMLMLENLNPGCIAYDRPSIKLSAFLEKHYNLNKSIFD